MKLPQKTRTLPLDTSFDALVIFNGPESTRIMQSRAAAPRASGNITFRARLTQLYKAKTIPRALALRGDVLAMIIISSAIFISLQPCSARALELSIIRCVRELLQPPNSC